MAVQLGRAFPTRDGRTHHARAEAERLSLHDDLAGDVTNREIAGDVVGVIARFLPALADELDRRVFFSRQKIATLQVRIAFSITRVDAGGVDGRFSFGVFQISAVDRDAAFELRELSGDFGENVPNGEADRGVRRIDGVGFGGSMNGREATDGQ